MINKTVFTFWEPRGKMDPYLRLCRKTWDKNLPNWNIVDLDYSNLSSYIPTDLLDIDTLKLVSVQMQKDAIMMAVLIQHGGVFMDIDTLIMNDIDPIVDMLKDTEVIMFSTHLAFVAAQRDSMIIDQCLKRIQKRLLALKAEDILISELSWNYLGNAVLNETMEELVDTSDLAGMFRARILNRGFKLFRTIVNIAEKWNLPNKQALYSVRNTMRGKRMNLFFDTLYRKQLTMLDRRTYGFIPEATYDRRRFRDAEKKYLYYWFESDLDVNDQKKISNMVIGLHNSWTPKWYKRLSEKEVLAQDCLLSKTIKHILAE